jgi:hypothetical protein
VALDFPEFAPISLPGLMSPKLPVLMSAKVTVLMWGKVTVLVWRKVTVLVSAKVTVKRRLLETSENLRVGHPKGGRTCFLPRHLAQPLHFLCQSAPTCGVFPVALAV